MIALIWALLVAALIVTLVLCTIVLARKFFSLVHALADFVSLPAILDGVHRADPEPRPTPAALRPLGEVRAQRDIWRLRIVERRRTRRDERLRRARALLAVDVTARDWFSS